MSELITMYENSVVVEPCAGYSAWRATFQSSEAAAKSAYDDASNLHNDALLLEQARKQDQDKIEMLESEIKLLQRKALIISKANEQLAEQCKENDALRAQVNELRAACEAVKHALQNNDIEGHVLWVLPPYQARAIHETAFDRLEGVLEQSTEQFLRDHDVALVMDLQQRCKGDHPLWGKAYIFLGEQRDRILKESDKNLVGVSDD